MTDIAVIVLTKNEHLHIARCLNKIAHLQPKQVFVVDCGSTDDTVEIAKRHGATVVYHEWPGNQAKQFNWGLENLPITTEWILRLDADEYLSPETMVQLKEEFASDHFDDYAGIELELRRKFLGREMRHATTGIRMIRLFRRGKGVYPDHVMDERLRIDGPVFRHQGSFFDDNLNGISWWTSKHLDYARREAEQALLEPHGRKHLYYRLPKFVRCFVYFLYRYFVRLGFLDGVEGFLWNFLQGLWYRILVDAQIQRVERLAFGGRFYGSRDEKIKSALKEFSRQ